MASGKRGEKRCEEIYEMEEIIGEGTFSSVVRGIHNDTNKAFAIKIIDKTKIENTKQLLRIYNEIAIHRRTKNPYIVNYVEHYETDIDVCIVMELCRGGELFNRIVDKGRFSEKDSSSTIKQILRAVEYLHSQGVVHRDIKPENILYSECDHDAVVKLADFGLAKQLEAQSGRDLLKASHSGTPAYCAPERLNMEVESKAVDMWSIGCILYFLLFGVPPFYSRKEDEAENEDEIFDSILEANVKFPDNRNISDSAKDLILKMLEKDPQKRINVQQALDHHWISSFLESDTDVSKMEIAPTSNTYSSSTSSTSSSSNTVSSSNCVDLKNTINRIIQDHVDQDLSEEEDSDTEMIS